MNSEVSNIEKELQDLEIKKQNAEARLSEIINDTINKIASEHGSSTYNVVKSSEFFGRPWAPTLFNWNEAGNAIKEFLSKLPVRKWKMSLIDKLTSAKKNEDWVFFESSYSINGVRYTNKVPVSTEFLKMIIESL